MNKIVEAENKIAKRETFTNKEIEVIKKQFFPQNATEEEMTYCLQVAESFGLNPILNQIYFVPRRAKVKNEQGNDEWVEKIVPLAGRDSFLTLAHRSGKFVGIESKTEIKDVPVLKNGKWEVQKDLVATCKVYRSDKEKPFVVEVSFNEYAQYTSSGNLTSFWKTKPETMLKKVAESQALRKAFNISGLFSEDELDDSAQKSSDNTPNTPKPQQREIVSSIKDVVADETTGEIIDDAEVKKVVTKQDIIDFYKSADEYSRPFITKVMEKHPHWREYGSDDLSDLLDQLKDV